MKKPSHAGNVFFFIILMGYFIFLTFVFVVFYGFMSLTDSATGYTYSPFLFDPIDLETVRLDSFMFSILAVLVFLQVFAFVYGIIKFSSNDLRKKSRATIWIFLFYFLVLFLIFIEYSISYTYGLHVSTDSNWVPQTDVDLVNKYILYFTVGHDYQYSAFLDPYSICVVGVLFLLFFVICIFTSSSKVRKYNLFRSDKNFSGTANSTVIINNPANNSSNPYIYTNSNKHGYPDGLNKPIIINNPIPSSQPMIINENVRRTQNDIIRTNTSPRISFQNNQKSILDTNVNKVPEIRIDTRQRVRLPHNNILMNQILKNSDSSLNEAKILIKKLATIDNNESTKTELLILIYKSCLNNNYLTIQLTNAIFEKIGKNLPTEFHQKNTQKSINYLLSYNKEGFKNLMYNLISIM